MAKIIVIYVGQSSANNLTHGIQNGIWGFKKSVAQDLIENFVYDDESYFMIGSGFTGGSPRVLQDEWNAKNLNKIYFGKISEGIYQDNTPEWSDEKLLEESERYSSRFRFSPNSLSIYHLVPLNKIPAEISEKLRLSAIAQSRGYLVSNIDIENLKHFLAEFITNIPQPTKNPIAKNETKKMNPKEIIEHTHLYLGSVGFQYQYEEIANFYLALKAKPFVILAGISGTGKTQLPRKFAEAIGMSKEQVIQVPVRPDWTDGSDLLGYTGLDSQFKPKDLTLAIQRACKNPDKPYFFILDEMNLARVEHYFSDFLSVIETREKKDGKITTDSILRDEVIQNAANASEFKTMGWPQNLYLIGTVNMDETTHAFSKKVLDRANSIEMNEVDLGWIARSSTSDKPLEDIGNSFFATEFIGSLDLSDEDKNTIKSEMELLKKVNAILQKADLHFAYRVRDEVAFYLILNKKYELIETNAAMDFQLVQKVLPRIHGSSERVQTVLVELLNLLEGKNFRSTNFEYAQIEGKIDINNLKYKRSSKKILFMLKRFDDDRFTSFWL